MFHRKHSGFVWFFKIRKVLWKIYLPNKGINIMVTNKQLRRRSTADYKTDDTMIYWWISFFTHDRKNKKFFLFLLISFVESLIFVNGFSNKEFKHGSFFFCWNQVNKVYKVQGVHLMYLVCVYVSRICITEENFHA